MYGKSVLYLLVMVACIYWHTRAMHIAAFWNNPVLGFFGTFFRNILLRFGKLVKLQNWIEVFLISMCCWNGKVQISVNLSEFCRLISNWMQFSSECIYVLVEWESPCQSDKRCKLIPNLTALLSRTANITLIFIIPRQPMLSDGLMPHNVVKIFLKEPILIFMGQWLTD